MNRFFRSALFPLVIIAALVWLALQTLGGHGQKTEKLTYSQVISDAKSCGNQCIDKVTFDPNKRSIKVQYAATSEYGARAAYVHYPSDQSQNSFQNLLEQEKVKFDSKGTGSSPWWSILTSLLPFVLLFGFWIFLMGNVRRREPRDPGRSQ